VRERYDISNDDYYNYKVLKVLNEDSVDSFNTIGCELQESKEKSWKEIEGGGEDRWGG